MEAVFVMGFGLIFIVFLVGIWIWSLIDAISNAKEKLLWVLIIIFLGHLGSILWWAIGERELVYRRSQLRPRNRRRPRPRPGESH